MKNNIEKLIEDRARKLRKNTDFILTLFQSLTGYAIIAADFDGNIIAYNEGAHQIYGYTPEEIIGKQSIEIFFPKDFIKAGKLQQLIGDLMRKGRWSCEGEKVRKNSTTFPAQILLTLTKHNDGKVVGFVEIVEDLTERKRMAEVMVMRKADAARIEQLRKSMKSTVQAMALTVEIRDPYTAGHQRRVAQIACAIAGEMGFSQEQIEEINITGLLHDTGKIYVPAEILSKPGRLTEIEFSMIKTHSKVGYDILKVIEFPWPIAKIVLHHHERMNGSGYPSGLSGEDILMEARILGIADVVEAMASHRPYRPAPGVGKALEEISHNKGVLYDPEAVDACLRLFTRKGFKLE